ncbi:hypothetical protein Hanom_Chr11g01012741 [Helianthus anomalus]
MKEMFISASQRLARFEYSFRFEIFVLLWIVTQDVFERTAGDCRSNDEVCGLHGRCLMKCLMG